MSSELIERLRAAAADLKANGFSDLIHDEAADALEAAQARIAALEQAQQAYKDLCKGHRERAEKAEAELAAVKADAERYRWLRDAHPATEAAFAISNVHKPLRYEELDAAIDAAMQSTGEQ